MDEHVQEIHDDYNRDLASVKRLRAITILAKRDNLTLGKLALLVNDPVLGKDFEGITLGNLFAERSSQETSDAVSNTAQARGRRRAADNSDSPTQESKPKRSPPPRVQAEGSDGPKSPHGRRFDYEGGGTEVLAAMKAAEGPVSKSELVKATGLQEAELSAVLKRLLKDHRAEQVGRGRATRYQSLSA